MALTVPATSDAAKDKWLNRFQLTSSQRSKEDDWSPPDLSDQENVNYLNPELCSSSCMSRREVNHMVIEEYPSTSSDFMLDLQECPQTVDNLEKNYCKVESGGVQDSDGS